MVYAVAHELTARMKPKRLENVLKRLLLLRGYLQVGAVLRACKE